jgi:hypothetical protein
MYEVEVSCVDKIPSLIIKHFSNLRLISAHVSNWLHRNKYNRRRHVPTRCWLTVNVLYSVVTSTPTLQ